MTGAAPLPDDGIPAAFDGYPVAVRTTGELRALDAQLFDDTHPFAIRRPADTWGQWASSS